MDEVTVEAHALNSFIPSLNPGSITAVLQRGGVLLVVEDDRDLRELFKITLRQSGFDVFGVGDGYEALAILDQLAPDAVVLDLGLPTVRGEDVIEELRTSVECRAIPIVVVTASDTVVTAPNVACTLRKPVTAEALVGTLRRCIAAPRGIQGV